VAPGRRLDRSALVAVLFDEPERGELIRMVAEGVINQQS